MTDRALLKSQLQGVPFVPTQFAAGSLLRLRLHRNCWDYSILVPNVPTGQRPLFSVLIAAFNSAATIARAIGSVLLQTVQDFEIVLVDDASTDDTFRIVNQFSFDSRIRMLRRPVNEGQSRCLNLALSVARGRYVVQLDSDDWLDANAIEKLLFAFSKNPAAVAVYGRPTIHYGDRTYTERSWHVSTPEACLTFVPVQAPRAYATASLRRCGGWSTADAFDGRYFEDRVTLARLSALGPVEYIGEPIYHVERHTESLCQRHKYAYSCGKLLALWQHANQTRAGLRHSWDGNFLRGEFVPRRVERPRKTWSVIIPARGRPELLSYTLRSWMESDLRDAISEIIVVDDASGGPINLSHLSGPIAVKVVRSERRLGPARARNIGAAAAQHDYLFFCDSDHIVPPDVIGSHEERHGAGSVPCVLVGGLFGGKAATSIRPSDMDMMLLEKLKRRLWFENGFEALIEALVSRKKIRLVTAHPGIWDQCSRYVLGDTFRSAWARVALESPDLQGWEHRWLAVGAGNLSMSVELFRFIKGFDESMAVMEDWDLAARCQESGIPVKFAPEVQPIHQVHSRDRDFLLNANLAARKLARRHPSLVAAALADTTVPDLVRRQLDGARTRTFGTPTTAGRLVDKRGPACFSLTFDDGPSSTGTPRILDVLEDFSCRATFFLLGSQVQQNRALIRRMLRAGHDIGLHGWHHESVAELTTGEAVTMLTRCRDVVEDACGRRAMFARPTYRRATAPYLQAAQTLRLRVVGADVELRDWAGEHENDLIFDLVKADIRGKVLSFHDGSGDVRATEAVLRRFLTVAKQSGMEAVSLRSKAMKGRLPRPDIYPHALPSPTTSSV
jgi:glycosyltransferase involved in cell wall biosynthesis/peptidoglycan/xylan/chitin deacetylase (PgdA/CDA1 family)